MEIKKLKLWKGRFNLLRIGNMWFERCEDKWMGFLEHKDEEIPIFVRSDEGFTLDQIQNCHRVIGMFIRSIENRNRIRKKKWEFNALEKWGK